MNAEKVKLERISEAAVPGEGGKRETNKDPHKYPEYLNIFQPFDFENGFERNGTKVSVEIFCLTET